MHLNWVWVLVASKMQSLRHGFAKRTTRIAPLLILRFKCRIAYFAFVARKGKTRGCESFSMGKNSKPLSSQERGLERGLEKCHEQ